MNDEIGQLEDFQKHPIWLKFVAAQKRQWQDELSNAIAAAANKTDDSVAIGQIRQIVAAQQAVLRSLEWPKEQLGREMDKLTTAHPTPSLSRGGFK